MSGSMVKKVPERLDGAFETNAVRVLNELRGAFLGLIEGLPGGVVRAADLEKALGVSRTLGWRIHRIATAADPLEAGLRVPGSSAVYHALQRARIAGVSDDRIRRAEEAMLAFESLVERHAGDRAGFETMLGSVAGGSNDVIDLKTRRQAFRANSQIWGFQVKTYLRCSILLPGAAPDLLDLIHIVGMRDVRRLRAGVSLPLMGQRITDNRGERLQSEGGSARSLKDGGGPILLREFCSQPLPEIESRVERGSTLTLLRDTPLGNAGVRTVFLASMSRGYCWNLPEETVKQHSAAVMISKPMEMLMMDLLIHRDLFGPLSPRVRVFGSLNHLGVTEPSEFSDDDELPVRPTVQATGAGIGSIGTPHIPRYREMVDTVLGGIGWDPESFDLYRCTLEYPLLNTTVDARFDLPDRGRHRGGAGW